jgi:small GTP-binding protein
MNDVNFEQKTPFCRHNKVVIIGDSFVGKTSILNVLVNNSFNESKPTIGANNQKYIYLNKNKEEIVLDLWDTAGQERYKSVIPMYYKGAKAIIIVFDITDTDTYEGAKKWIEEIQSHNNSAVLSLLGNKIDLENRKVNSETVKNYSLGHKINFYECSAKDNINIKEVFDDIAEKLQRISDNNTKLVVNEIESNVSRKKCCL